MITAPDRTLLQLDSEIRRSSKGLGARIVLAVVAALALVSMYVTTFFASESGRGTIAALCALLVIAGPIFSPLLSGVGNRGLAPQHVRHLPVPAEELRRALAVVSLRGGAFVFLLAGLLLGVFAVPGASGLARAVAAVVAVVTAVVALVLARVAALRVDAALNTSRGRIVAAIVGTVLGGAVYALFVLLQNVSLTFADNDILGAAARIAPSGWAVVSAEAVDDGRWWLPLLILVALVAGGAFLVRRWTAAVSDALDGSPARRDAAEERRGGELRVRGPLRTLVSAEALQLVLDPRRIGLLLLPSIFLVVGVVLMFSSNDIYGMRYGAPVIVVMAASAFSNSYGLDGPAFWRVAVVPGAAQRIVDARMIVGGAVAALYGVVGTVLGHAFGGGSWSDVPVAVAVIVAGAASVAAVGALQSALSPYAVTGRTAGSAMNARGSMSGRAVGWSVALLAGAAVACAPGALLAALLDGPLAMLGPVVGALVGAAVVAFARPKAVALVAERGPEIYVAVSRAP